MRLLHWLHWGAVAALFVLFTLSSLRMNAIRVARIEPTPDLVAAAHWTQPERVHHDAAV